MGKFDGMLLVSDFDNTLVYTTPALKEGRPCPDMVPRNLQAINHFMEEGGRFAVATGRSLAGYRIPAAMVPANAPAIVNNGGGIYHFEEERFMLELLLPDNAWQHIAQLMDAFPTLCLELCDRYEYVQVMRPTPWNDRHAKLTGAPYHVIDHVGPDTVNVPLFKALLVEDQEILEQVRDYAQQQDWGDQYEFIFSSSRLLEMTAQGANKGEMVKRLMELYHCKTLICAGDHLNDMPMLQAADRAFCPANAQPELLAAGCTPVCHCQDGAIADIVEILEREVDGYQ